MRQEPGTILLLTLPQDRPHPIELPEITRRHRGDDSPFLTERHHVPLIPLLPIPVWPPTIDHNPACKTNPSFTTFRFDPAIRSACGSAVSSRPRAHIYSRPHGPQKPHPYVYSHPRKRPAILNVLSTANLLATRNEWPHIDWHLHSPEGPVGSFARIWLLVKAASLLLLASVLSSRTRRCVYSIFVLLNARPATLVLSSSSASLRPYICSHSRPFRAASLRLLVPSFPSRLPSPVRMSTFPDADLTAHRTQSPSSPPTPAQLLFSSHQGTQFNVSQPISVSLSIAASDMRIMIRSAHSLASLSLPVNCAYNLSKTAFPSLHL
jgi:hypothetical protein